ncbi:hypothetical protein B0H10DRAFT_812171 [Mycena sp. CBHHK59/15]|nr:hypothetical protein B0H10DRAFT_812171 [Mycena sp. CBHHK59/15]
MPCPHGLTCFTAFLIRIHYISPQFLILHMHGTRTLSIALFRNGYNEICASVIAPCITVILYNCRDSDRKVPTRLVMDHVPTLNDLRVKSCFICLEEEREPGLNTANDWVHPCPNCASVAHDKCLIRWISSLPLKQSLKREDPVYTNFDLDTFKCPHCGRPYEMANPRPPALHGLAMKWDTFYVITSEVVDLLCAAAGFVTIQVIPVTLSLQSRLFVLSGVFLYELYFLESFLGPQYVHPHCKNHFNHRVVHFSLFSLLLTRKYDLLQSIFIVAPTIPFRLLLPGTLPRWIIPLYLSFPPILHILTELEVIEPLDDMSEAASASHSMISFWPPSPALLGLSIAAVVRPMYNLFLARFRRWVLGTAPPPRQKRYLSNRVRSLLSFGRRAPAAVPAIMQDQDPARIVIADQIIQKDQSSLTHDIVHAVSCVVSRV